MQSVKINENKIISLVEDTNLEISKNIKVDVILINTNSNHEINLQENAEVNIYEVLFNNNSTITSNLNGKNSKVNTYTFFFGNNQDEINIKVSSVHNNENTKARLVCKGILNGKAKLNYSGKIKVEKGAKNSDGYQKQDTLLLSDESIANSIPELEINEHEVKCSHGVTLSNVDENNLFYLQSRGLSKKAAEKQIILGFLEPLIIKIENDTLKNNIIKLVEEKI